VLVLRAEGGTNVPREGHIRRSLTLAAMSMSQGMILLDVTIVNVGLPAIQRELHASPGTLEWVISAYALVLATLIPFGGMLGDRYGRKRVFTGGLLVFTAASVACALAASAAVLIAFRAVQGVGGAVMSALTLSILSEAYPAGRRAGAIGMWAAAGGLGFGLGPVAGGLLLSRFGWSSIFWVNVPIGVTGAVVAMAAVRESRDPARRRFDVAGLCLCGAGLFGATLGLIESAGAGWASAVVMGPLAGGFACLAGFVWWERRAASPMVPMSLWRAAGFRRSSCIFLLFYAAQAGLMFYVTLLFQDIRNWSALRTGLSWLLMNIPFFVMAQLAGRMSRRFPPWALIGSGCLVAAIGTSGLAQTTAATPFALVALWYVLFGAGCGLAVPLIATAAMADVSPGVSGVASGILNAGRQVGTSVGLAVLGSAGVGATVGAWHARIAAFPDRPAARALTHAVSGGQLQLVRQRLGTRGAQLAVPAFLHGFDIAVSAAAVILLAAAAIAYAGLSAVRKRRSQDQARIETAEPAQLHTTGTSPRPQASGTRRYQ
jgi:MFS transporter, DHA2 family, methylenomycin A resistance protein